MVNKGAGTIFNERRLGIVRCLTNNNGECAIKNIAERFGVTERTIRYDLDVINSFLMKKDIPIYLIIKDGSIIIESDIYNRLESLEAIKDLNLQFDEYLPSSDERISIILLGLLFAKDFITIKYLSERIGVSKNTIKNDLEKVKGLLEVNNISPKFIPGRGLYVEGEENFIRSAALKIFRETLPLEQYIKLADVDLYDYRDDYFGIIFNYVFNNIDIKKIQEYIFILQKKLDVVFPDFEYADLAVFLGIILQRVRLGRNIAMEEETRAEISRTNVYKKVKATASIIYKLFHIDLIDDEIIYISLFILSSNIFMPPRIDDHPHVLEYYVYITDLIAEVGEKYDKRLINNENLLRGLSAFGLPFYYRQKYNIPAHNPYLKEVKANYKELFKIIKSSISCIGLGTKMSIPDEEIGFITLYFATALQEPQKKLRAIILTETGLPIGNLIAVKLKLMLNIDIVSISYLHEGKRILDKERVDFIITTSPFIYRNIPYVVVSPILTREDIMAIRDLMESISNK